MQRELINVVRQFSRFPYGRYPKHGPDNGERFRKEFLEPALRAEQPVLVDLDGTRGLGPSFLDEAFAGLLRAGFSRSQLDELVEVKSDDDPSYIVEIKRYIEEEVQRQAV